VLLVFFVNKYQNRYQSFQGSLFNGIVIALLVFILASGIYLYLNTDYDLTTYQGILSILKTYSIWLGSIFDNFRGIVGYAVKQDWSVEIANLSTG